MMAIEPSRPESVGGVLDIAFRIYEAAVLRVMPMCALLALADLPLTLYSLQITRLLPGVTDPREFTAN